MAKQNVTILTLFGNLGSNPDVRLLPAEFSRPVYDPAADQVVEKTFTRQEPEFRTFSIAMSTKEMTEPRWIRCVDWNNLSRDFQKGDRVRLTGYFQIRTYQTGGETRRIRQFVVQTASLERAKIPQPLAA